SKRDWSSDVCSSDLTPRIRASHDRPKKWHLFAWIVPDESSSRSQGHPAFPSSRGSIPASAQVPRTQVWSGWSVMFQARSASGPADRKSVVEGKGGGR